MLNLKKKISAVKILTTFFFFMSKIIVCAAEASTTNKIIGCVSNTPVFPLFN